MAEVLVGKGAGLEVDFVGQSLTVGSKVMLPLLMPCGVCDYCLRYPQTANRCLNPTCYGRYLPFSKPPHLWGGWAEMVYVDLEMLSATKIYWLPDDMSLMFGSLAEPLISCIRALNRAVSTGGFRLGDTVVVQGAGPIGVLAVAAAQEMGAGRVVAIGGPDNPRLAVCREFGAEATVDIKTCNSGKGRVERVRAIVGGHGADLVLECSGHPSAGPEGIVMLRDGDTFVEMGQFTDAGSIEINWHRICAKDINLLGSWAFTANDIPLAIAMLARACNRFPWHRMQKTFPFTEFGVNEETQSALAMQCVKATIVPNQDLL